MKHHSELAYSWPAIPFGLAIVVMLVNVWVDAGWLEGVAVVLAVGAFVPCALIRDWWVRR